MPYTWPSLNSSEVLSSEGAKTTGRAIFQQQDALKAIRRTTLHFPERSTASAAFVTVETQRLRIPGYPVVVVDAMKLRLVFRRSGGTTVDMRFLIDGLASAQVTTASTSNAVSAVMSFLVQAGWPASNRTIEIQLKANGGATAFCSGEGILANLWYDS